jgi:hypothetical protein
MPRTIIEQHAFSKEDIEELIKRVAYRGTFENQEVSWNSLTGGATVLTRHTPEKE